MPFTSRTEYGLRAMVLLAEQLGEEVLSAAEISRREQIPAKYLEQILGELKRAGLLLSTPGARGGYRLARPAAAIPLAEITTALDGPVQLCRAEASAEAPIAQRLTPLWDRIDDAVSAVLHTTTLDQLAFATQVSRPDRPSGPPPRRAGPMYHI